MDKFLFDRYSISFMEYSAGFYSKPTKKGFFYFDTAEWMKKKSHQLAALSKLYFEKFILKRLF